MVPKINLVSTWTVVPNNMFHCSTMKLVSESKSFSIWLSSCIQLLVTFLFLSTPSSSQCASIKYLNTIECRLLVFVPLYRSHKILDLIQARFWVRCCTFGDAVIWIKCSMVGWWLRALAATDLWVLTSLMTVLGPGCRCESMCQWCCCLQVF